jgi:hypothetical protein
MRRNVGIQPQDFETLQPCHFGPWFLWKSSIFDIFRPLTFGL